MTRNDISYQGPSLKYESYIGSSELPEPKTAGNYGSGYADVEFLLSELDDLSKLAMSLYRDAEAEMIGYTLLLNTADQTLIDSHKMSYPEDDTPDSMSFKEYIYNFSESKATSSRYVNRYYENKVRGMHGTNALDIAHVSRIVNSEVKRIESFIDTYIGEIDDDTELRVLESFQDWTENAKNLLPKFRQAFQSKGVGQIPQQEMAELTETKAKEFQGLFQSKLNIINSALSDQISQLYKDWDLVSDMFYNKILGPSLKFNLSVGRNVHKGLSETNAPILYQEAVATSSGLQTQLKTSMSDQVKRNNLFYDYMIGIFQNIIQRDTYVIYLDQLSVTGTTIPNYFITQLKSEPLTIENSELLLGERSSLAFESNSSSDHSFLTGSDNDDAHPQYLKRTGDTVNGDLEVVGRLRINGKQIENLFSFDSFGNVVINAGYISWTDLDINETNKAVNEFTPDNLSIIDRRSLATGNLEYTVDFDIENGNVQGYEFEIIEL